MRASRAKSLREQIIYECAARKINFRKLFYRRAKKQYNALPRSMRSGFTLEVLR